MWRAPCRITNKDTARSNAGLRGFYQLGVKMRIFLEQAIMMILVMSIMAAALAGMSLLTNLLIG